MKNLYSVSLYFQDEDIYKEDLLVAHIVDAPDAQTAFLKAMKRAEVDSEGKQVIHHVVVHIDPRLF